MADTIADHIREINHGEDESGNLVFKEDGTLEYVPLGQSAPVGSTAVVTEIPKTGYAAEAAYPSFSSKEEFYAKVFECAHLKDRCAMVIGQGSIGSEVTIGLLKEGCGHFIVVDHDRVEPHNLSRHVGGVPDIDRLKVDVMEDAILRKNPFAVVEKYAMDVCKDREKLKELMIRANVVICATDNNTSRYVISSVGVETGKTIIYSRAETRAEGLNIFIQRPGAACYNCLIAQGGYVDEEITNEASARANGTIPSYTSPEDAGVMVQIGLPADIAPLVDMTVKLALVEMTRGMEDTGIETLSEELAPSNFFVWINHRDRKYHKVPPFSRPGPGPRILRWYGCNIPARKECCTCGEMDLVRA
jgi:molybdopterin/thiamine biosynthesis adenylyltransferase